MNGMTRCQGYFLLLQKSHFHHPWWSWQRAVMFRMNGQDFCSMQILSAYIHIGNDAVPGLFFAPAKIAFPPSVVVMPKSVFFQG
jgi:hypothetical protein